MSVLARVKKSLGISEWLQVATVDPATGLPISSGAGTAVGSNPYLGTLTDRSGTITLGGTAQSLEGAVATRRYFFIENISDANQWINFGTTAVQAQPSILLVPGASYAQEGSFVSTDSISIIGATTGKAFTAKTSS